MASSLLISVVSMGALGGLFGAGLAWASRKFAVQVDPRIDAIEEALPGANCGGCGQAGCRNFAEALVEGKVSVNGCPVGGSEVAAKLAEIMGVEVGDSDERLVAKVRCRGGRQEATQRADYIGITDCRAALLVGNGPKGCEYGCLGLGSCVEACPFDAIRMGPNGIPVVDTEACTACGNCVAACPQDLIALVPESKQVHVLCRSFDKGKDVRQNCQVGCIGCKACEKVCPVDAIHVTNFLAEIDYDKCINCGACAAKCPTKAIVSEKEEPGVKVAVNE